MGSPVHIPLEHFIKIDRGKEESVYMQIVYQFVHAVKQRLLEDGDLLPGSRRIASQLGVHRKTIVAAWDELQQQGWIETVPSRGTLVRNPEEAIHGLAPTRFHQPPEQAAFYFNRELILDMPVSQRVGQFYLTDGTPDERIIGAEELVRFYASVLKRKKRASGSPGMGEENLFFREQLSYYLNVTRGFGLSRNFLLPISGREQVFTILSRLLIHTGDVVLVERLSNFLPNMIFSQAGAKMKTVPVDENGMDIHYIRDHFKVGEIRLVYLNTRCQYPTTVGLSEERKAALLELAEQFGFVVIEDDVDFEFSGPRRKRESLFSQNKGNRVIYIGAFGRFLNPGFQMNFLIAPGDLLEEGKKYLNIFGSPNLMLEKALGEIILQGDIFRYQRKSNKVISERKELFAQLLERYFGARINFTIPASGLAFWIRFNAFISLVRLQEKASERGLIIPGICLYQNRTTLGLRLGFAHLNPTEMEATVRLLYEAYHEVTGSLD